MIHIGLCDDERAMLDQVSSLLETYRDQRGLELRYTAYQSPLDLMADIERGMQFDILFLDVIMPGENGLEAAAEVRKFDQNVKIIFLTSSQEFAVQSYAVGAYYYQLKPIWPESFFRLTDSVLDACRREQTSSIVLQARGGITRIDLDQLEFCEVIGKTIIFHLASGKLVECQGNMERMSEKLIQNGNFFRAHRSYTVNLDYIMSIRSNMIVLRCGEEISLPRGKFGPIKDAFLARAFQEGWECHG